MQSELYRILRQNHGQGHNDDEGHHRGEPDDRADKETGQEEGDVGSDHEDIAMGEVDQAQHPVNQGVAQGDESIKAPPLQGVQNILNNEIHWTLLP